MRLRVVAVGRLKDRAIQGLCETYLERARRYLPIDRLECRDLNSAWQRAGAGNFPIIVLDERGDELSTLQLARFVAGHRDRGTGGLGFVIGDSHGIPAPRRAEAERVVSLSRLTFPHRLAQLLLCEQLYRVGTVLAGHPYHHL